MPSVLVTRFTLKSAGSSGKSVVGRQFRVLHCLRSPVGGLFRHVLDLARAQIDAGCSVGILADSSTGGPSADAKLAALAPDLALGVTRISMPRSIGLSDYSALLGTQVLADGMRADVLHGHGAKGGAYARLAARRLKLAGSQVRVLYTPHGGSLHYESGTPQGLLFLGLEQRLAGLTDGLIFESDYSRRVYETKVGRPNCPVRVIANGLLATDFIAHKPEISASDVLFVGELRKLKGVDVLLEALASITSPWAPTATIVGTGPDEAAFKAQAVGLGLSARVTFAGALPAAMAFPKGKLLVVPSRAESFPYIVLEGAAAGMPMLASDVGGIPEIMAGGNTELLIPGSIGDLSQKLTAFLSEPSRLQSRAIELRQRVSEQFTVTRMADDVMAFYANVAANGPVALQSTGILPAS